MKKVRGEMTVFLSLTLMLVAALLFTLVEGARYRCLASYARMDSVMEANSSFAEFDRALLEDYGLLYLDDSYGTGKENLNRVVSRIMNLSRENLDPKTGLGTDFLRMEMKECSIDAYELATDYKGDAFRRQLVEFAKENLPMEAVDILNLNKASPVNAKGAASFAVLKGKQMGTLRLTDEAPSIPSLEFENPLDFIDSLSGKEVLALVAPKDRTISVKRVDLKNVTDKRNNNVGNYEKHKGTGMDSLMWYLIYMKHYFGNFLEPKEGKALDYEMEYMLYGKDNDRKNLECVCGRIMEIREALNLAYLETDAEKSGIATIIATIIALLLANPEAIEALQKAILLAWAHIESLQEMRRLLMGGRIPYVKNAQNWITDVLFPVTSFSENFGVEDDPNGISYQDFLTAFIAVMTAKKQNYRMMSMMELNIRQKEGKGEFRMDCMMQRMDLGYVYEAKPLFLSFVTIGKIDRGAYRFNEEFKISYLTGDG